MKVLIVEPSPQIAERLAQLVYEANPDADVIGLPVTEDGALIHLDHVPDVALVITELQLAQGTGFGILRKAAGLQKAAGTITSVVLTNHAVPALKVAAFEAGADYFLDKSKDFGRIPRIVAELS